MPRDDIPATPHHLDVDLSDGVQRVYLGDFHNDGRPTPPREEWREICQCEKHYVPREGALCADCARMYREAAQFARDLSGG
jgi:hypothetical protein